MNRLFTKKGKQTVLKSMKRCPLSLKREIQIQAILRAYTIGLAENNILPTLGWQGCGESHTHICVGGNLNQCEPHGQGQQFGKI